MDFGILCVKQKKRGVDMSIKSSKNAWALALLILCGIVLGGFIGMLTQNISALSWLNYGQSFGLTAPITLDLGILVISFGLSIKITIASIIGVILSVIIYKVI